MDNHIVALIVTKIYYVVVLLIVLSYGKDLILGKEFSIKHWIKYKKRYASWRKCNVMFDWKYHLAVCDTLLKLINQTSGFGFRLTEEEKEELTKIRDSANTLDMQNEEYYLHLVDMYLHMLDILKRGNSKNIEFLKATTPKMYISVELSHFYRR